jgi:hypothetical protein
MGVPANGAPMKRSPFTLGLLVALIALPSAMAAPPTSQVAPPDRLLTYHNDVACIHTSPPGVELFVDCGSVRVTVRSGPGGVSISVCGLPVLGCRVHFQTYLNGPDTDWLVVLA